MAPARHPPAVGIVVLNYESPLDTVRCVRTLRAQAYPHYRIFLIDNASRDGSEARLRAALPGETVVQRGRNLGYGDGNNVGIDMALADGAALVWIVSPDVLVSSDCLPRMVALMEQHPDVGICGPVVHAGERAVLRWSIAGRWGYQAWAHTVRDSALASQPGRVESGFVDGGAMLVRSDVLRQIGGFRTEFFMYCEDCEFCLRAADAGWKVAICTAAHVYTRPNDGLRNQRYYYMTRNSIALARLRRSCVWRTVARHLLLVPAYRLLKGQRIRTGLAAVSHGLSMPLGGEAR